MFEVTNETFEVLFCENFRRRHVRDLEIAVLELGGGTFRWTRSSDRVRSSSSHCRLATSHISFKKPGHWVLATEVGEDVVDRFLLGISEWEGEARGKGLNMFLVCDYYITRRHTNLCAFSRFGRLNIKYFLKSKTLASTLCVLGFLGGVNPLQSRLEYW